MKVQVMYMLPFNHHEVFFFFCIGTGGNQWHNKITFATDFPQSDTQYHPVSSNTPTKEKKEQEKEGRGSGGIDKWGKLHCSCFMSWWKNTRQGTRQTLPQSNYREQTGIKCIHLGTKMVKNKLELQISMSQIICWMLSERILVCWLW